MTSSIPPSLQPPNRVRVLGPVSTVSVDDEDLTPVLITVTASGDTTVHTPAAGKKVILRKIQLQSEPGNPSQPLIEVKLGSAAVIRGYSVSERQRIEGAIDDPLVINLDAAGNVSGTAFIQEA